MHFSDERRTDNVTGYQYQQHRHGSYTSPGITCNSRQLENAEAEKPLSAGCTWNVSGKAGVHNTDSYDVISTLASGGVELSHQKPCCKATKLKHEPSRCLFIVHLSDSTTEDDLTTFAETYGPSHGSHPSLQRH